MTDETTTEIQPTKEQIILSILGLPEMQFVDWQKFMGEGVVVEVEVGRIRFRRKNTLAAWGIQIADKTTLKAVQNVFTMGMQHYLPPEQMSALENAEHRARWCLEQKSIRTVWGRFVPVTSWPAFKTAMEELKAAYFVEMQKILDNYDAIKLAVIKDHMRAAKNAYKIMKAVSVEGLSEDEIAKKAVFLKKAYERVMSAFPSKDAIERSFSFNLKFTYIDLPRLASETENTTLAAPGSIVTKTAIEGLTEDTTEQFRWSRASTEQKQRLMRQMNDEVVREAKERKQEQINRFLNDIILRVRGLVYETCTNVLASVQSKQALDQANAKSLRVLIKSVRELNFYGDADVDRVTDLLSDLLPGEDRGTRVSPAQIQTVLRDISLTMRTTMINLDLEERGARESDDFELKRRAVGVPDEPTQDEERAARESLGFSMPEWLTNRAPREDDTLIQTPVLVTTERGPREW